jgi:hypothetical protein
VRLAPLAAVLGAIALAAPALAPVDRADAKATLRIVRLRVVQPDGITPAKPPYRRERSYFYEVEYLVGGSEILRVTRAATIVSPEGVVAIVRPPATVSDPGRYRVTSRIQVGRDDPPGVYTLRYTIVARSRDGDSAKRRKELRMRFV